MTLNQAIANSNTRDGRRCWVEVDGVRTSVIVFYDIVGTWKVSTPIDTQTFKFKEQFNAHMKDLGLFDSPNWTPENSDD